MMDDEKKAAMLCGLKGADESEARRMKAATEAYQADAHGMQTGVDYEMTIAPNNSATSPKHLRVGINAAMSDMAALADLLMAKGVFTEVEYVEALAVRMKAEKEKYEKLLSEHYGREITLR